PGEFSKAISSIGGQENAFTSFDYTGYYQKVSPDALEQMMAYEADRMLNLTLEEDIVAAEREVILEERAGRVDDSPGSILSEFLQASLFVHHPYGVPVIGWEHEIVGLSREDILAFYEKWYQPWNAIVVVAGDVEADAVLKLAQANYGKVEATRPETERVRVSDPPPVVAKTLNYSDVRVTNPSWRRMFVTPSYRTGEPGEGEALDLLAAILGESVTSRIYREIVLGAELATSAGAFYQGSSRDDGTFGLYASPRGEATVEEVQAAMERQIDLLLEKGITQEELDRARRSFLRSVIYSQDSQVTLARIYGSVLASGGAVSDVTGWPSRLETVTVEDINKVARKYLVREHAVSGYLLPEEQAQ
ncbi:MAG: pitrilysin family protein, partial [Pseudomonadota bacterium]